MKVFTLVESSQKYNKFYVVNLTAKQVETLIGVLENVDLKLKALGVVAKAI